MKKFIETTISTSTTSTDDLINLQKRIARLEKEKISAQKEVEMLKKQYDEKIVELEQYGITNVQDLPKKIAELKAQYNNLLEQLNSQVTQLEQLLQNDSY